jgi:hypothetical protein
MLEGVGVGVDFPHQSECVRVSASTTLTLVKVKINAIKITRNRFVVMTSPRFYSCIFCLQPEANAPGDSGGPIYFNALLASATATHDGLQIPVVLLKLGTFLCGSAITSYHFCRSRGVSQLNRNVTSAVFSRENGETAMNYRADRLICEPATGPIRLEEYSG